MLFEHNPFAHHAVWSVLLAVLVCLGSGYTVFRLVKHARTRRRSIRTGWALLASTACAAGVWSTHFIAMLGYAPGLPIGFDPVLTIGSLGLIGVGC